MKNRKVTLKMIEMATKVEGLMNALYNTFYDLKFLNVYKYDGIILLSYEGHTAIIQIRDNDVRIKYRQCDEKYIQRLFDTIYEWNHEAKLSFEVD